MNILLVAASTYAPMCPYVSEIVNNFEEKDNIFFLFKDDEKGFYRKNISKGIQNHSEFFKYNTSFFEKLFSLFFTNRTFIKTLNKICEEKNIDSIHFLTDAIPFYHCIMSLQKKYKIFYTVHDLYPHEMKKNLYITLMAKFNRYRRRRMYFKVQNLITNSEEQYDELKKIFPHKQIYFHDFPTLVNQAIKNGTSEPSELKGKKNYLLFFGRIEKYKGIDLLYEMYIKSEEIQKKYILVIAGKGSIYFERDLQKEENVIFLNRHIEDEEVKKLYQNAYCVIYPYISATQSGVFSLSSFFQTPTIASDVSYFRRIISKSKIGLLFKKNDMESLQQAILLLEKTDVTKMKQNQQSYYDIIYNPIVLKKQLLNIYNS